MNGFEESEPAFHNQYFTTRQVLDYGRRHTTLTGLVKDKTTNKPLAKVEVEIAYTDEFGDEKIEKAITNKEGEFLFEHVQAREYEVRSSLVGYIRGIEKSDIRRGKTNKIEIILEKSRIA